MGVAENIKRLRTERDLTQEEFGKIADVSAMAVSQWENGRAVPRMGAVQRIADYFGIKASNIIDDDSPRLPNARPAVGMAMGLAPRLGKVHAGVLAEPDVYDEATMVSIPQFLVDEDPDCFVVSSEGDCMDKVFSVGSDLVVSRKKQPRDNSIVMASVDGCDYIVRRLRMTANTMILSPESHNPAHEDIIITRDSEHTLEIPGVITWYQAPREMG